MDLDHPARLCRNLADGSLDVAFVSSFEFLSNPIYTIVDGVALASDGPVYSVVLAHMGSLEQMEEVVLDPASLTSVNLLRCLLAERGLHLQFVSPEVGGEEFPTATRARLLIGDHAIRFREQSTAPCKFWDLGEEWKRTTGLPFVFALWLIRPEVDCAKSLAARLRARRDENLGSLDEIIAAQNDFDPEFCRFYFLECLRFGFSDAEKQGLSRFRSLCEKHQILPPNPTPLRLI